MSAVPVSPVSPLQAERRGGCLGSLNPVPYMGRMWQSLTASNIRHFAISTLKVLIVAAAIVTHSYTFYGGLSLSFAFPAPCRRVISDLTNSLYTLKSQEKIFLVLITSFSIPPFVLMSSAYLGARTGLAFQDINV